mmetsp:Transcript_30257/g.70476  ORF Transcript_30257/g.70476 Transcript_30257/m.70476 type:complete len:236 (-) Transcript_30257:16-723(-)
MLHFALLLHIPNLLLLAGHLRHLARCRVRAPVLLFFLLRSTHRLLDKSCLHDAVRHVRMVLDAADLGQMLVPLHKSLRVLSLSLLARQLYRRALVGLRPPDAHVGIIRSREDVRGVHRPAHREEALHPLSVVHMLRRAPANVPYAQRLVVGARHELLARGRVVDGQDGGHVARVHADRVVELAHVKCVQIVILRSEREVHRLHRIPAHGIRTCLHGHLLHSTAHRRVVQSAGAVG